MSLVESAREARKKDMKIISLIGNSGGVITDWNGNKDFYSGKILAASNKILHLQALKN